MGTRSRPAVFGVVGGSKRIRKGMGGEKDPI
mgnify:CR=1 FL=1